MNDPQPEGSHGKLHRTTKILNDARRRCGRMAARGARTAGGHVATRVANQREEVGTACVLRMTGRRVEVSAYALELGRLDTSSCQRVKYASSGAIFMSAKRPPISIATNAVISAIVKRSPATYWCPFSSRSIRSRR
jgi:hypothetical protein